MKHVQLRFYHRDLMTEQHHANVSYLLFSLRSRRPWWRITPAASSSRLVINFSLQSINELRRSVWHDNLHDILLWRAETGERLKIVLVCVMRPDLTVGRDFRPSRHAGTTWVSRSYSDLQLESMLPLKQQEDKPKTSEETRRFYL